MVVFHRRHHGGGRGRGSPDIISRHAVSPPSVTVVFLTADATCRHIYIFIDVLRAIVGYSGTAAHVRVPCFAF